VVELIDWHALINIEIKTPKDKTINATYDTERLVRILYDKMKSNFNLKNERHIFDYSFVSSFDHTALGKLKEILVRENIELQVKLLYISTRYLVEELPGAGETNNWGSGTNMQSLRATQDIIQRF
jgi:hypothetical protein